jgi:putative PEP-CTERM system integral membrane protein
MAHRVNFPGGDSVLIRPAAVGDLPQPAANLNLAVVLDRSRSMAGAADEVSAALARLSEAAAAAALDVYLTASPYRGEDPSRVTLAEFDPDNILYFGGQNAAELLLQFDVLQTGAAYDAIFVLTDGSGYELTSENIGDVPIPEAPLWMVHLDGDFPLGYDDDTLEAIQASGGGVAGSVDESLARLAAALEQEQEASTFDVIDGYAWSTVPGGATEAGQVTVHQPGDDFAAFAARRVILGEMSRQRGQLADVDTLDRLHAIAVEHSVVTPYSSMIVVVTSQQEQRLKLLEAGDDRFQREYEAVGETAPDTPFDVTGVPEPEEWLLLGLAAGMLGWYIYTNRRQPRREIIS